MIDPKRQYTAKDLEEIANAILLEDSKSIDEETGRPRGIGGDNPILFESHLKARHRREIMPRNGIPDPAIIQGIYNRTHPEGRKVNSDEQRQRNGAAYYR